MSITVNNPEALTFKHEGVGGISTRGGVITGWPDSLPALTQELIDSYDAEYQAHLDATAYADKRKAEYPEIGDQLDALWKDRQGDTADADAIAADIAAVKVKYPKG